MTNRLAPYKDPVYIEGVREWFGEVWGGDAYIPHQPVPLEVLWHSYYEWCVPTTRAHLRLEYSRWLKVVRTAGVTDIGGRWQVLDTTPTDSQLRRTR